MHWTLSNFSLSMYVIRRRLTNRNWLYSNKTRSLSIFKCRRNMLWHNACKEMLTKILYFHPPIFRPQWWCCTASVDRLVCQPEFENADIWNLSMDFRRVMFYGIAWTSNLAISEAYQCVKHLSTIQSRNLFRCQFTLTMKQNPQFFLCHSNCKWRPWNRITEQHVYSSHRCRYFVYDQKLNEPTKISVCSNIGAIGTK